MPASFENTCCNVPSQGRREECKSIHFNQPYLLRAQYTSNTCLLRTQYTQPALFVASSVHLYQPCLLRTQYTQPALFVASSVHLYQSCLLRTQYASNCLLCCELSTPLPASFVANSVHLYQPRQPWGDCLETEWSSCGPFRALRCHLELKLKTKRLRTRTA